MLEKLKKQVYEANMDLPRYGLVTFTWGNVSGIDREKGLFVIKPSGIDYGRLSPENMVVMDLKGNKIEGEYSPSSDMKTHLVLYNAFSRIGGIVHTHSPWATSWAQAGRDIPCYGTTHADYFYGYVPCLRGLTKEEIDEDYEYNTGKLIVQYFLAENGPTEKYPEQSGEKKSALPRGDAYVSRPCVLCRNHGPFTWGKTPSQAVYHAVVLEEIAKMACRSESINPTVGEAPQMLQDKHYMRKHGPDAYYGQSE